VTRKAAVLDPDPDETTNGGPSLKPLPLLLRPSEVAEQLGLGLTKAYELIASKQIPSIKIGTAVRVPSDALRAWVAQQQRQ
jgi:excisionase family DNA binding protein